MHENVGKRPVCPGFPGFPIPLVTSELDLQVQQVVLFKGAPF